MVRDHTATTNSRSYGTRRFVVKIVTTIVTALVGAGGALAGEAVGLYEIDDDTSDCREYDVDDVDGNDSDVSGNGPDDNVDDD